MLDRYNRKIDYLRISITDRCNLRCIYCMSEDEKFLNSINQLSFEDFKKILRPLKDLGIEKVKITGGEPLVREGVFDFIKDIKKDFKSVTITTNGNYSLDKLKRLISTGVDGINVSIDTLDNLRYKQITRFGSIIPLEKNLKYLIENYKKLKINVVLIKGFNDDEIENFANLSKDNNISVRFIELMPIGVATNFLGIKRNYIIDVLEKKFGKSHSIDYKGNGPASYISFNNFKGRIGFIDALNHKFCSECNRIRLDSYGNIITCLHHHKKYPLREYLNDDDKLKRVLENLIYFKPEENKFLIDSMEENSMNKIGG